MPGTPSAGATVRVEVDASLPVLTTSVSTTETQSPKDTVAASPPPIPFLAPTPDTTLTRRAPSIPHRDAASRVDSSSFVDGHLGKSTNEPSPDSEVGPTNAADPITAEPEPSVEQRTRLVHWIVILLQDGEPSPDVQITANTNANCRSAPVDSHTIYELNPVPHTSITRHCEPHGSLHVFALTHPFSGEAHGVQFRLPGGSPELTVDKDDIEWDYGSYDVEIQFKRYNGRHVNHG